jgi:hypothetical protein
MATRCLLHRRERSTVDRARAMLLERQHVLAHGVALMPREAIRRVLLIVIDHARVARGLGEDRCGGDRQAERVAMDDPRLLDGELGEAARVDQQMLGRDAQGLDRAANATA